MTNYLTIFTASLDAAEEAHPLGCGCHFWYSQTQKETGLSGYFIIDAVFGPSNKKTTYCIIDGKEYEYTEAKSGDKMKPPYDALGNQIATWTCETCGASGTAHTDIAGQRTAELVAVTSHPHPVRVKVGKAEK